jgi:hypothetical protein
MDAGGVPASQRDWQRTWASGFYDGRMKELSGFLDAMPGGLATVKALVLADPALGMPVARAGVEAPSC